MTRFLAWLLAALALAGAACASIRAEQARRRQLTAELDALSYGQPIDEIWTEVRRLLADGQYPMAGVDARATGQKEELLAAILPSRQTRETPGGGRLLETSWGEGQRRYRAEAFPVDGRWRVLFTAIQRDSSMSYSEERSRDLEMELELTRRLDPEAAARIEAGLGVPEGGAR